MLKRTLLQALFFLGVALLLSGPAQAQTPSAHQRLDSVRAELDQIGSALRRPELKDSELAARRADIEPLATMIQEIVAQIEPRVDSIRARLEQLGPKGEREDAAIEADRAEQQKSLNEADGLLKRARAIGIEIEQAKALVSERRRDLFARALFAHSSSILSPDLWLAVFAEIPRDIRAAGVIGGDWLSGAGVRLEGWRGILFFAILAAIAFGYVVAARVARGVLRRAPDISDPTRLQKVLGALWVAVVTALVPIIVALAVAQALRSFDLINARLEPLLSALVETVRRVAIAAGLARGLLAPFRPTWRLLDLSDAVASRLTALVMGVVAIVSLMKVTEAINELIAVSLPVAVAVRATGALSVALLMAFSLKGIAGPPEESDECLGPRVAPARDWYGPLRFVAWIAIVMTIGAVLIGYVAFGAFIAEQIVWLTFVGAMAYLLVVLANEGFEIVLSPPSRLAHVLMTSLGLRRESLAQIAVLLSGLASVCIVLAAALVILAPWGIESDDMLANLRSAFFGFKIGDVTISLSSIVLAILLFGLALFATRAVQNWLENRFLPRTQLDTGLRNSIRTSIGYVGFILAAAFSLGYLGLSFEKLAIVAGALSVGIGFGLQSIVNNFVSGLILLWERAIRVGDWVVVGDEQGYVRRINVRSTEIETFDRATMIVPNSNLVTGVVKNWVRTDKVGRIKVPVAVNLLADPGHVRDLLIAVANGQDLVEKTPAPTVMFISMTESMLKFELICFVADVEKSARVKSDLQFAIHARFKEAEIGISPPGAPPAPPAIVNIGGLEKLAPLLDQNKK